MGRKGAVRRGGKGRGENGRVGIGKKRERKRGRAEGGGLLSDSKFGTTPLIVVGTSPGLTELATQL